MVERRTTAKAARTRHAILGAAERLFAEHGFESTRLEDVAGEVGIRRASIVYYFRDKAELYEAVLDSLFGELLASAQEVFSRPTSLEERVEEGINLWVYYLAQHPALASILLRELPNTSPGRPAIQRYTKTYNDLFAKLIDEFDGSAFTREAALEQIQIGGLLTGATLYFIAATPALAPGFDPLAPENIDRHRDHMLAIARQLVLGERVDPTTPDGTP
jgi:AcrR family transcriptional regulator